MRRRGLELLRPDERLEKISSLTPTYLEARGLRGLILDLDNTLVPYGVMDELPELLQWACALREGNVRARLVSNALPERVRHWSAYLGIEGVGVAGKPWPANFRRACREMNLSPAEVAVVGDQVFTDVLGGNLIGAHTILVAPLSHNALPHTRLARLAERLVLGRR